MKKTVFIGIVVALVLLAFPPNPLIAHEKTGLTFKGCSIIRRAFMSEAAKAFEKATGTQIRVMGGGATLGIRATAAGDSDIGGSCRPPLPEWFPEESGVYMTHTGWDCLVFITNLSNPVNNITLEQAKGILKGKITNWRELGGPDKQIIPVFRSQVPESGGKISGVGFMTRLMLFNDPDAQYTDRAIFYRHSAEVEETIEKIEYTFGVTGSSSARKRSLKILTLDGISPTKENILSGKYPLFEPLYLITKGKPVGHVKEFVDWILGKEGQELVSKQETIRLDEGKSLTKHFRFWRNTHLITNND